MPILVVCSKCGNPLLEEKKFTLSHDIYESFFTKIISQNNGKCPRCGHKLTLPAKNIEVKPYLPSTAKTFTTSNQNSNPSLKNRISGLLHQDKKEKGEGCPACGSRTRHYDWCPFSTNTGNLTVQKKR